MAIYASDGFLSQAKGCENATFNLIQNLNADVLGACVYMTQNLILKLMLFSILDLFNFGCIY